MRPRRTTTSIIHCVDVGLAMIDRQEAAIIRDRFWRERTWPAIAHSRSCSVTTAVNRYKRGMEHLRQAVLLVDGQPVTSERSGPPGFPA